MKKYALALLLLCTYQLHGSMIIHDDGMSPEGAAQLMAKQILSDSARNKALAILKAQSAKEVAKDQVEGTAKGHYDTYFEDRNDEKPVNEEQRDEILGYMRLFLFVAFKELESNNESDASAAASQ